MKNLDITILRNLTLQVTGSELMEYIAVRFGYTLSGRMKK